MKKFFQSKGFIVSSLALLCITILGVCWFVSRDRTGDFRPDESPPSSVTGDWSDGGTQTDGDNGADAYAPGQSTDAEEEYPKVTSQTEDEVVIDFTDTEKPEDTSPPVPEGKTEIKDPGQGHAVNPDPSVPEVTAPPAEQTPPSNEPAPGSSNGNGAVYDPVFGWVVPGNVQQSTGDSDGDLNKQVGNMADLLQLNMALLGRHRIVAAFLFSKGMERDVFETTSRLPMLLYPCFLSIPLLCLCNGRKWKHRWRRWQHGSWHKQQLLELRQRWRPHYCC